LFHRPLVEEVDALVDLLGLSKSRMVKAVIAVQPLNTISLLMSIIVKMLSQGNEALLGTSLEQRLAMFLEFSGQFKLDVLHFEHQSLRVVAQQRALEVVFTVFRRVELSFVVDVVDSCLGTQGRVLYSFISEQLSCLFVFLL